MHLFDPATGENLTLDKSSAGTVPTDAPAATSEAAEEQDAIATPAAAGGC